jgi:glycine/D-amino acid oxidase-like deaminating enzyme
MYRSYVLKAHLPQSDLEEAIYWDQANPYNYFRIDNDGDGKQIIFGGADHRADIPVSLEKNFRALENSLKNILAGKHYTITGKWRGPILEPSDGLPLIGAYQPKRYIATAFSGNGMTYSIISALLFQDLLSGNSNPLADVYDPTRKLTAYRLYKKGFDYAGRFFGGAVRNMFS